MSSILKIGEVAKKAGVGVETLRFYETRGLIEPVERTRAGYRIYDPGVFERLSFIRKAQSVGFTLDEIARLIREAAAGNRPCAEVRRLAAQRLEELESRIKELQRFRRELRRTVDAWEREGEREGHVCGLIEGLDASRPRPPEGNGKRTGSARRARKTR